MASESKSIRATVSLSRVVNEMAEELMKKKGYDNFSAYIAELIRRDKERDEERGLALVVSPKPKTPAANPKQTKGKAVA